MNRFVVVVEKIAGYFIGVLAVITISEAFFRYVLNSHIPDGFIIGQTMQGIAICWGISTATYADRQISVDILYELGGARIRRAFDLAAYTIVARVFLNLDVKKDEVDGYINTSIGDVPQINKRNINTAVLVEDGQTVVIGGVYEFRDRSDLTKVPFLADIPFLGNLFKRKNRSKEKAELLIFVTPKVMKVAQR